MLRANHPPQSLHRLGAFFLVSLPSVALLLGCGGSDAEKRYTEALDLFNTTRVTSSEAIAPGNELFAGVDELNRADLVRAVLARNPDLEAARQAWRAALARFPQVTSPSDPILGYGFAPLSVAGGMTFGQEVRLSQDILWPGKLDLPGEMALREAEVMQYDVETLRRELGLMAVMWFNEYYAVTRSIEIVAHHVALMEELRENALSLYAVGRGSQGDALQAESELAAMRQEQLMLETERQTIMAQINGLLHRTPGLPLPPPPASLAVPERLVATSTELMQRGLDQRPEIHAADARIQGATTSVEMGRREYYPDFMVEAVYNSMVADIEHQFMIGFSLGLPIRVGRRGAAVDQAQAEVLQARRERSSLEDQVATEIWQRSIRLESSYSLVDIIRDQTVPTARDRLEAARFGYETGIDGFLEILEAENTLRQAELELELAIAELHTRRAQLEAAIGQIPGVASPGE